MDSFTKSVEALFGTFGVGSLGNNVKVIGTKALPDAQGAPPPPVDTGGGVTEMLIRVPRQSWRMAAAAVPMMSVMGMQVVLIHVSGSIRLGKKAVARKRNVPKNQLLTTTTTTQSTQSL
ncbi:hypothetical protein Pelo_5045 [Pelomyxa schiedti]|nr:hypothetical protein Pelo_5045 [Pelomyxa schiedti]